MSWRPHADKSRTLAIFSVCGSLDTELTEMFTVPSLSTSALHSSTSSPSRPRIKLESMTKSEMSSTPSSLRSPTPKHATNGGEGGLRHCTVNQNTVLKTFLNRHGTHAAINLRARRRPGSSLHTMYTCLVNRFSHINHRGPVSTVSNPTHKSSQKHPLGDCPPHESTHVSSAGGDGGSKHCTSTPVASLHHQPPAYNDPLLINSYLQARLRLGSSLRKMYTCGPQTKGIKDSNTLTGSCSPLPSRSQLTNRHRSIRQATLPHTSRHMSPPPVVREGHPGTVSRQLGRCTCQFSISHSRCPFRSLTSSIASGQQSPYDVHLFRGPHRSYR